MSSVQPAHVPVAPSPQSMARDPPRPMCTTDQQAKAWADEWWAAQQAAEPRLLVPEGVHEGYGCRKCGIKPIVGVRYHASEWRATHRHSSLCANCYGPLPAKKLIGECQNDYSKIEPKVFTRAVDSPAVGAGSAPVVTSTLPETFDYQIVIPEGLGPGADLTTTINGVPILTQVPEGCGPGSTIQIQVPAPPVVTPAPPAQIDDGDGREYGASAALLAQLEPRADLGGEAPVRLLKGSWMLKRADELKRAGSDAERARLAMPCRQELPPEAFLTAKQVEPLRGHGRRATERPLRLVAVSHGGWLSAEQCDPKGEQLVAFANVMRRQQGNQRGKLVSGASASGCRANASSAARTPTISRGANSPSSGTGARCKTGTVQITTR